MKIQIMTKSIHSLFLFLRYLNQYRKGNLCSVSEGALKLPFLESIFLIFTAYLFIKVTASLSLCPLHSILTFFQAIQ